MTRNQARRIGDPGRIKTRGIRSVGSAAATEGLALAICVALVVLAVFVGLWPVSPA